MSIEVIIVEHQRCHHGNQRGKSTWEVSLEHFKPLLIAFVTTKEDDLRSAISNERITRDPEGERRNVFYIKELISGGHPLKAACPANFSGCCIEVVVVSSNNPLQVEVHGFPANIDDEGIFLEMGRTRR